MADENGSANALALAYDCGSTLSMIVEARSTQQMGGN